MNEHDTDALRNVIFAEWGRGDISDMVEAVLDAGFHRSPQWGVEFQDGEVWRGDQAATHYLFRAHPERPALVSRAHPDAEWHEVSGIAYDSGHPRRRGRTWRGSARERRTLAQTEAVLSELDQPNYSPGSPASEATP